MTSSQIAVAPAAAATPLSAVCLPERSILVSLRISEWRGRRRDKKVTHDVALQHGADTKTAGIYTKALVPKKFLSKLDAITSQARTLHYELTLPWLDDGQRILPIDLHLDYMEKIRELRSKFETAVAEFLGAYDEAKAAARTSLGDLYRESDYPSLARLETAFAFAVKLQPLPVACDWRVDLPEATVAEIRRDLEAEVEAAQRVGLADLYRRLAKVVSRMATTLAQPDKVFRLC
ncbi:MAG TPA: hypothetical protein VF578_05585 [Methylomirabilota bacterium]